MGKRLRTGVTAALRTAHASAMGMKMAAHLLALTADGGVPLFSRSIGDLKTLPFTHIGTLNAIHLYSRLRGGELQTAITVGSKILWRVFHNSVILILATSEDATSDSHLFHLLDNIFAAMVMMVGVDSLQNIRNVDHLKRELRICFFLVDHLLQQLDQDMATVSDLTGTVDCLLCTESPTLQNYLTAFVNLANTSYGCLMVRGKVAVATKKWWSLAGQEMALLSVFVNTYPKTTSREVSIYLPNSCPMVCNKLVTLQLTQGVEVCVLCGPVPSLNQLEEEGSKLWKGAYQLLKSVSSLHPHNFPSSIVIDRNILGFILIHREHQSSLCSVQPLEGDTIKLKDRKCVSLRRRQEILRALYKLAVGIYFPAPEDVNDGANVKNTEDKTSHGKHSSQELYICTEHHKCYVLQSELHQLYILFSVTVPTYAMRSVAHRTMKILTRNKLCVL
ncbi:fuzzy planar cell polarity protein-like protein isoform X2 [Tachypleus tridentatus]|uniref:fuzzy planar cell polarity protein-like protein isoform X2 n=1 Tax=Tachypleus tridentatus TaxID=6853 RepID=UPI003FCF97E2